MRQFKHEPEDYEPLVAAGSTRQRPFWVHPDELYLYDRDDLRFRDKVVPISSLTAEEFRKYQQLGAIPSDYQLEDWIKE